MGGQGGRWSREGRKGGCGLGCSGYSCCATAAASWQPRMPPVGPCFSVRHQFHCLLSPTPVSLPSQPNTSFIAFSAQHQSHCLLSPTPVSLPSQPDTSLIAFSARHLFHCLLSPTPVSLCLVPPHLPPVCPPAPLQGAGTLTLRRATGEEAAGKRPYFVFTTDSGALAWWVGGWVGGRVGLGG